VWRDTLRDLQWRRRRFVIVIIGAALVFALTLLVGGIAAGFRAEAGRTVDALGMDEWITKNGAAGPFTSISFVPAALARQISALPGVRRADPIVITALPVHKPQLVTPQVIGFAFGGLGSPPLSEGRAPERSGEVVVDKRLGAPVGAHIMLGARDVTIVGRTRGQTLFGGVPNLYAPIGDVQRQSFNGFPLATAILVRGHPARLPSGLHALDRDELRVDMLHPVLNAISTIDVVRLLLWLVAGSIIAAVVYLSALERVKDFAVFKATGAPSSRLLGGLVIQSTIISLVAAGFAAAIARLLAPIFPLTVEVPASAHVLLVGVALVIGVLASAFAVRRASTVDPALAFGGP